MIENNLNMQLVVVRGGGDIASGTIQKLYACGYSVLILEVANPSAIRRNVAFSEAVYEGTQTIEGITCYRAENVEEAKVFLRQGRLTLLVDPFADCLKEFEPIALVDGIIAKKNLGTHKGMAPITVALGPGFTAGKDADADVDAVIETMRGHSLGRIIYQGSAMPNTGVPGKVSGYDKERVVYSPAEGIMRNVCRITFNVKKGEIISYIDTPEGVVPVYATLDGLLRGLLRDGYPVTKGFKIADIDPRREEYKNCFTISDKARCIAGGVLEAILALRNQSKQVGS